MTAMCPNHTLSCHFSLNLTAAVRSPTALFTTVVQEISHMLQQQAAHLSIKRAASGISALDGAAAGQGGHKRHSGGPSALGVTGGGSLLGGGEGGQQG